MDEIMVPPMTKRTKHNEEDEDEIEENEDRLSDLPDCVLLHILSLVKTRYAVPTCLLSRRWKDLWKRLPGLILHTQDFWTRKQFTKFVSRLLSLRDGSITLHTLDFERTGSVEPHVLKRVVNYAISHNVQRLGITVECDMQHVPPAIFSCQTLTSLKLSVYSKLYKSGENMLFPNAINLPAVTSLHLRNFTFCAGDNNQAEPFSAFNRLNDLTIEHCAVKGTDTLCISSTTLVNLTLGSGYSKEEHFYTIELSTPNLCTFVFTGAPYQLLCGRSLSSLSSVKRVHIDADIVTICHIPPKVILCWLAVLPNIKSLTVSSDTLQVLFLHPNLLKMKLPFLSNLKSLKVKVKPLSYTFSTRAPSATSRKGRKAKSKLSSPVSAIPDGILDFLLQNSPSADIDIIDCKR